jgi:hypothetical protein
MAADLPKTWSPSASHATKSSPDEELARFLKKFPAVPKDAEDTGLGLSFIADLITKHVLFMTEFKLWDVAERVKLPLPIVDAAMDVLKRGKLVEVLGAASYSTSTYTYKMTELGRKRAMELLDVCRYMGPAPVVLDQYSQMVEAQTIRSISVTEKSIKDALSDLVITESLLDRLGPAVSSGKTLFFYGPPGNGKSTIAEAIGAALPDNVYIPYAITVGGQIISVFDPINHIPVEPERVADEVDQRWVLIKRPVVITGGELTLRMLDLDFNPISKYYEASLQMKANNGLFIADDFGRQQVDPRTFLNRWMVPLDRRVDFMSLHTGMKFAIPFDVMVIFSTNIEPKDLVDEAFLRRIPYKIKIDPPTEEEFELIFKKVCETDGVRFDQQAFNYLRAVCYRRLGVSLKACHARDLLDRIIDSAQFSGRAAELTKESIDLACLNYFVEA